MRGGSIPLSRSGFTIIELLVVIAIISLLAGLSAGAFLTARRNHRLAAAAGELQGLLRAARNTSVSSGTPSFVVVDPSTRRVWAQSFETAGEWSFESVGGDGEVRDFVMSGGSVVEGRLGSGVNFEGEGGTSTVASVRRTTCVRESSSRRGYATTWSTV